jgi:hypothetical protein
MLNYDPKHIEQHLLETLRDIKYGSVEVVIHDSRVVQIEKTEKTRFDQPRNGN